MFAPGIALSCGGLFVFGLVSCGSDASEPSGMNPDVAMGAGGTAESDQGGDRDGSGSSGAGASDGSGGAQDGGALDAAVLVEASVDVDLSLPWLVQQPASEGEPSALPSAPRLVVGEGADAQNHTLVRILDQFGVCSAQFLAYPSVIRGGVDVQAGLLVNQEAGFVASPLTATGVGSLRVFDASGGLRGSISVDTTLAEPYSIAVGDFDLSHAGDEVAVTSVAGLPAGQPVFIYSATSELLASHTAPAPSDVLVGERVQLSTLSAPGEDELVVSWTKSKRALSAKLGQPDWTESDLSALPESPEGVFDSASSDEAFVVPRSAGERSFVSRVTRAGEVSEVEVGKRETLFWARDRVVPAFAEGDYVKRAQFRHLRVDAASPMYRTPDFENTSYSAWVNETYTEQQQANAQTGEASVWQPTYSHRQFLHVADAWITATAPGSALPRYLQLTKTNEPAKAASWDVSSDFNFFSYALGVAQLERLYVWPQRHFLRRLGEKYRGTNGKPEHFVAVAPNHEFEVEGAGTSVGDYNPAMIAGFRDYLVALYATQAHIDRRFGTDFAGGDPFDAPRDAGRGAWDAYAADNDFFVAWVNYNRKVILTWIARGMREALWAGFPPELIKTHQIPHFNSLERILEVHRVSPVDWIHTTGTGYGGTRYGVWYQSASNFIARAESSGQHSMILGEYDARTTSNAAAFAQLSYLFDHGVNFINHMNFNAETGHAALEQLASEARPRLAVSGETGIVRAVCQPQTEGKCRPFEIIAIGSPSSGARLLKSVHDDGSFEGTVYVTPFRSKVDVEVVGPQEEGAAFLLAGEDYRSDAVDQLLGGDRVTVSFRARSEAAEAKLTLLVLHDGVELPGKRLTLDVGPGWQNYRYSLSVPYPLDSLRILINSGVRDSETARAQEISIEDFSQLVHRERSSHVESGLTLGQQHRGGVTFDVLSREQVPGAAD